MASRRDRVARLALDAKAPPAWFSEVMDKCEAIALDDARDRVVLWSRLRARLRQELSNE